MKETEGEGNHVVPIPADLLLQIFEKLGAKSLSRFKCVSKHWCSMIEDPEFVDAYRVRSRNRGRTDMLIRRHIFQHIISEGRRKMNEFFLVDLEGKSLPLPAPNTLQERSLTCDGLGLEMPILQHVEGLVLCNNTIWNPTTGNSINLPPRNPRWEIQKADERMEIVAGSYNWTVRSEYFLGFDVLTKKYKVLSICWTGFELNTRADGEVENRVYAEVFTLGTDSWKITKNSPPQELSDDIKVQNYFCINGIIYIIMRQIYIPDDQEGEDSLLAFNISQEKFQLLPLPRGVNNVYFAGELRGRFAVIGAGEKKIWILEEDFNDGRWRFEKLLLPKFWYKDPKDCWRRRQVCPISSNPSGEILFEAYDDYYRNSKSSKCSIFLYNMESRDVRMITELSRFMNNYDDIFPNLVETIHPLK